MTSLNRYPAAVAHRFWRRLAPLFLLTAGLLGAASSNAYDAVLSAQPDRSSPVILDGQTISGGVYVFVIPEAGIKRVDFFVNDPQMSGPPDRIEKAAPYDLGGTGSAGEALAFDSASLSDGINYLTIVVTETSGARQTATSTFTVANSGPALVFQPNEFVIAGEVGGPVIPLQTTLSATDGSTPQFSASTLMPWLEIEPASGAGLPANIAITANPEGLGIGTYSGVVLATADGYTSAALNVTMAVTDPNSTSAYLLSVSTSPARANPVDLHGATVNGDIYVFTRPDTGVTRVEFFVDKPTLTGTPYKIEKGGPFDLAGTAASGDALPFKTTGLSDGPHSISARITTSAGTEIVHANFTVANVATQGSLTAMPATLSLSGTVGAGPVSSAINIGTVGTPGAGYSAAVNVGWLSVSPTSGVTPGTVTVTANPAGLVAGSYSGSITLTAQGYASVTVPVTFAVASSGKSLQATPGTVSVTADAGGSVQQAVVDLLTTDGANAGFTVSSNRPWLSALPTTGQTPATLTISVNPATLIAGNYSGTLTVTAPGYDPATIAVDVVVQGTSAFSIQLSSQPDRTSPVELNGAVVAGDIYVFTQPESGVSRVDFYIDNPTLSGTQNHRENSGPFDLAGTAASGGALPFKTTGLSDGPHSISARITTSAGTEIVHANFTVANVATQGSLTAMPATLSLSGTVGAGPVISAINIGTVGTPGAGYSAAVNVGWLSVSPTSGVTPGTVTVTANPAGLVAGSYSGSITLTAQGYASVTVPVTFAVASSGKSLQATPGIVSVTVDAGGSVQQAVVDLLTTDGANARLHREQQPSVAFGTADYRPDAGDADHLRQSRDADCR